MKQEKETLNGDLRQKLLFEFERICAIDHEIGKIHIRNDKRASILYRALLWISFGGLFCILSSFAIAFVFEIPFLYEIGYRISRIISFAVLTIILIYIFNMMKEGSQWHKYKKEASKFTAYKSAVIQSDTLDYIMQEDSERRYFKKFKLMSDEEFECHIARRELNRAIDDSGDVSKLNKYYKDNA